MSIDGGGHFFCRPRHKFSVTNVCGYLRIRTAAIDYRYLAYHLRHLHSQEVFDYTLKAHPSVIRGAFRVQLPRPSEQRAIATVLTDVDELIGSLEALIAKKRGHQASRDAGTADREDAAAGVRRGVEDDRVERDHTDS